MTDDKLMMLAEDVDGFIIEMTTTYKLPLLSALAILLARVTVAAKSYDLENDLSAILDKCQLELFEKPEDTQVH